MKTRPAHGVLLISIDVAAETIGLHTPDKSAGAERGAVLESTKWLVNLLDQYRLPATWFFAGPCASAPRSHVVTAAVRHEIGLLVSENGANRQGRLEFSRGLERRLLAARAAGIEISSLAMRESQRVEHLDLLVKLGIRAVRQSMSRPDGGTAERLGWGAVSTLRFGISNLPATLNAAQPRKWTGWMKRWDDRRQLIAAAGRRQYCHLSIDVHDLAAASARKRLQTTMRIAARLFHDAEHRIETMTSLAASLMARPSAPRAQSILRAA